MRRECWERFTRPRLQRKPLISDPGMHRSTCVTHVPWCMSVSLTHGGGEGIPGACATRNFMYLARGPWLEEDFLPVMAQKINIFSNLWNIIDKWIDHIENHVNKNIHMVPLGLNPITGDPLHSRAACTQPCNVNTHSHAHCYPGARLCEQWGHGCVNNGARLCASARLCRGSPVTMLAFNVLRLTKASFRI